ncbi:MAG: putative rane protein [Solirubrobacterales bacterium]|jgi:cytochrome c oxidase assembly factor CtaG|nr:putative rane protein [Solirubrobacterales bacterium]
MYLAHVGGPVFEPLQVAVLTLVATAYSLRAINLSQENRPVPSWRLICFASGLALIAIAFVSPLGRIDDELVLAHMGQHLLMGDVGPLLLVLGLTGPLLQPLLANRWLGWLRHLAHPLVALPLWAADLFIWHVPVLYQAATEHSAIHALQHSCFIGFGVLMWMPLLGPLPKPKWFEIPAKIGYLIGVRLIGTVLANVFMWSNSVFYPHYAAGEASWHIAPLTDQSIAGVIMMVEGGFVTLGVLVWLFLQWAQQDTERQRLLDLADSRGVPLSDARAARAAAAGQGARLEERIKTEGSS